MSAIRYVSLYSHKGSGVLVTNLDRDSLQFRDGFAHALNAVDPEDCDYTNLVTDWLDVDCEGLMWRDALIASAVSVLRDTTDSDWNADWTPWTVVRGSRCRLHADGAK